jgi:hypothetical protein
MKIIKTLMVQGALATAGKYSLNSWVVAKRGPAYPPMFTPLSLVFTVVLGSILLRDIITLGRSVYFLLENIVNGNPHGGNVRKKYMLVVGII